MSSRPLNLAFIGCGAAFELLHRTPLELAVKNGWARLVAAADPNPARLGLAASWFPGMRGHGSAADLFAKEKGIDLTIIASPPPLHESDCAAAFAAGSHVLCEKPLAGTVESARAITAAAEASGRRLALGMTKRFYPAAEELRTRLRALPAGTDIRFLYRQGGVYDWKVASEAPFRRRTGGGGVLLDWGVHLTDTLGSLFGWGRTAAAWDDATGDGVEANAIVDYSLERASGRVHLSWDTAMDSALHVRAGAEEYWMPVGYIDVLFHRSGPGRGWQKTAIRARWARDLNAASPAMGAPRSHNECMTYQLIGALRSILHGEPPAASGADGVAALELIHAAYGMAQPLAAPWLPAEEQELLRKRHWRSA